MAKEIGGAAGSVLLVQPVSLKAVEGVLELVDKVIVGEEGESWGRVVRELMKAMEK